MDYRDAGTVTPALVKSQAPNPKLQGHSQPQLQTNLRTVTPSGVFGCWLLECVGTWSLELGFVTTPRAESFHGPRQLGWRLSKVGQRIRVLGTRAGPRDLVRREQPRFRHSSSVTQLPAEHVAV